MPGDPALPTPPSLGDLISRGPVALFLDFDGTLVDIAARPDGILVPEGLNAALCTLSDRLGGRLALISGRAIVNIQSHLGPLRIARAGSHGMERQRADGSPLGAPAVPIPLAVREEVALFAQREGFETEEKPHGAALHCRARPEIEELGVEFAGRLADRHGLLVKRGKCVIELVARGADKGNAVRAFMNEEPFAGSRPLFVGDDITDEDGFAAVQEFSGAGILIGERTNSRADYRLADPRSLHEWLEF